MGESKCFQWNMNRNNCCAIPSSLMFNTLLFIFSASHHCQTDTSGSLSHTRSLKPQKLLFFLATTLTILNLFLCRIVTGSDEFLRPKMASLIILVWEVYIYQWKLKWKLPCELFLKKFKFIPAACTCCFWIKIQKFWDVFVAQSVTLLA